MLVKAAFGPVALGTVLNGTLVVPRDLRRRSSMPLLLLIINFERHIQHYLVIPLVRLKSSEKSGYENENDVLGNGHLPQVGSICSRGLTFHLAATVACLSE